MSGRLPWLARLLVASLAIACAPARAAAYDTVLDVPLHEGRGGPIVGDLSGAVPTTIRFRDGAHADVAFRTSAFELRGAVDLAEGQARIRSARRIVLGGSPFRIEVEPGTSVRLVHGARAEVALEESLPVAGLDTAQTRLRVAGERDVTPADTRAHEPCAPVHLWPEPRVHGPVIRTALHARLSFAPSTRAGWNEVWVHEGGIVLRGYTWMARHCGELGAIGTIGREVSSRARALEALAAGSFVASSERAPWTVRVLEAIEVERVREAEHTYFVFPLQEGIARVEGMVRR